MEFSFWPLVMQVTSFLILLVALGEGGLVLFAGLRRYFYEQDVYVLSLESFEERLMAARTHTVNRGRESNSWAGLRKFRVARKVEEGGGISSFYLEAHDNKPIPSFKPGQYLTFSLDIPGESRPLNRCYSLSDSPDPTYYRVTIKKIPPPRDQPELPWGKSSSFFHDQLEVESLIDVKAPSGDFFLDMAQSRPVVLIGGGVGITPVLSMLNAIADRDLDREVYFFYGVRNEEEHIQRDHLSDLAARFPQELHLNVCYSGVPVEELPIEPNVRYHSEFVSVDLFKRELPSSNFAYFICGPPPMMNSVTTDLREWGVPDADVHWEAFGPATVKQTPRAKDVGAESAQKLMVNFAKSGTEIQWDPESGSLLEFADDNGIVIDSACRAGSCGTCVTAIKEGEIEYLADPGSTPDSGTCLTCISVPKSDLVLDA
ncbi:MAG: 2Fe-2S iron-sulfur cluster-binding protein [Myxococcota bacterium]